MPAPERFQVTVTAKDPRTGVERELRIGPILQFLPVLEEYAASINKAVAEGKEKDWRDARVVPIDRIFH